VVGPSSGDKGRFPKVTKTQVSHCPITATLHNDIPASAFGATPRGTLIVSLGERSIWCAFFLDFFLLAERTDESVEGTTEAVSVVAFCRRVRGAMLIWQDNGEGRAQEE
jgi:hypothetical protein